MKPLRVRGIVLAVSERYVGAILASNVSIGATAVPVDDPEAFDEDGGQIQFGRDGEVVAYTAVDDGTGILTTDALAAGHTAGEHVWAYPLAPVRYADLQVDGDDGEAVTAIVGPNHYRRLPIGTYDEPVAVDVRRRGLDLVVARILGRGGITPPAPTSVTIFDAATDRIVVDWDAARDPANTDLLHSDVEEFQVQLSTSVSFASVYKFDRSVRGSQKSWRVASGSTYYARVRAVDRQGRYSAWIPATLAGNSDPGATASGVTIGAGGGMMGATFTKLGKLRVKHYANRRWTNTTGQRLYFKRARATVGDKEAATGAPTGSAVKLNLKRWNAAESSTWTVFRVGGGGDDDDRLRIAAGTYKDENGPTTFEETYLDPDEALTLKVAQVGSSFAGQDLTVQVYMEP